MFHDLHGKVDQQLLSLIDKTNVFLNDNNQNLVINYPNAPISTWLLITLSHKR